MEKEKSSYPCGGKGAWIAGRIVRGIVIGLVFALVFGIFVMMLWNWLMPGVFGLREIGYGQAIGLVILAHVLFGAKGIHHGMHHGMRHGFGHHGHGPWARHGHCSTEDVANGRIRDWRRYDEWWNAEGREAFRKYIDSQTE